MTSNRTMEPITIYQRPVELLQSLIRFDTTNPPGNEKACIDYIDSLLTAAGFETKIIAKDPARPNLLARLEGTGDEPPLLLQGHVDVVEAYPEHWQCPPFEGKILDGWVWGRGVLDMKGGVAMMLSAFLRAKAEGLKPCGDIILALLSDEETGGKLGARYLVENHAEEFAGVRHAIGEFGGFPFYLGKKKFYQVQVTEKQISQIKVTLRGPDGYAMFLPPKGNVNATLGRLLVKLDQQCLPVHITPVARTMMEMMSSALPFPGSLLFLLLLKPKFTDLVLKLLGEKGRTLHPLFHNNAHIVRIEGGQTDTLQIPNTLEFHMKPCILPGYTPDDMISELKQCMGAEADFEVLRYDKVLDVPDMSLYDMLAQILKEEDPEGIPMPFLLPTSTDGKNFARLGIQTYGFLPMDLPPDFNFTKHLHAHDERIPVKAVEFGARALYKVLERYGRAS